MTIINWDRFSIRKTCSYALRLLKSLLNALKARLRRINARSGSRNGSVGGLAFASATNTALDAIPMMSCSCCESLLSKPDRIIVLVGFRIRASSTATSRSSSLSRCERNDSRMADSAGMCSLLLSKAVHRALIDGIIQHVDGETLRDRLKREKQLPIDEALRIACELADALDHAHALGLVHRHLKPRNVWLADGTSLLNNFGIAAAISAATRRATPSGFLLGSPPYMSPEQLAGET